MKGKLQQRTARKRNTTSLFIWVWGAISLLCLLLLLIFSLSQRLVVEQTFRYQLGQDLSVRGQAVKERLVGGKPDSFDTDDSFMQHLSTTYEVSVVVIDGEGVVAYSAGLPEVDFTKEIASIKQRLAMVDATSSNGKYALYQTGSDYAYVTILGGDGEDRYLFVGKDVSYIGNVFNEIGGRTALTAVFVFIISFAVSAAVSGMFTKPIDEIKNKAKLLAKGDFSVDFHGDDYGREMAELADSLNFARDELAKTDEMQKELIANVSHDFKTPLTMIKGYASMIIEISGENKEKREKHAQVIIDEADRLTSLVSDLLDLSKLQGGMGTLVKEKFDLSAYIRQVIEGLDYLREKQGYDFVVEVEDEVYIEADKGKIGQAVYNLIGNAVNYTGEDKKVFISLKNEGGVAKFTVRDTGEGIAEEEIKEIWDRYYRSKSAHKRPVKGTGLGLSIVRKVLEMHGVYYGVDSKTGEGSCFYVHFPALPKEKL